MRAKLTRKFVDTGYDATPMVPCSELNDIFDLQGLPGAVFCSREEEAVAVGAGMHIAGRQPLVLMQSSGLMSSLNTVGSLPCVVAQMNRIPHRSRQVVQSSHPWEHSVVSRSLAVPAHFCQL